MILIVGLGNPGEKYAKTRHNLGFRVVDALAREYANKQIIKYANKFKAEICQLNSEIILAKPLTFMNTSGFAVAKISQYRNIPISNIWIIHDDVDLPLGKLKIRFGGAAAGHHGVESVIKELGTDEFVRFRLGVGPTSPHSASLRGASRGKSGDLESYVLKEFDVNERTELKNIIKKTVKAVKTALDKGIERAMNEYNA